MVLHWFRLAGTERAMLCSRSRFLRAFLGCFELSLTAQVTFGRWKIRRQTGAPEGHWLKQWITE